MNVTKNVTEDDELAYLAESIRRVRRSQNIPPYPDERSPLSDEQYLSLHQRVYVERQWRKLLAGDRIVPIPPVPARLLGA